MVKDQILCKVSLKYDSISLFISSYRRFRKKCLVRFWNHVTLYHMSLLKRNGNCQVTLLVLKMP